MFFKLKQKFFKSLAIIITLVGSLSLGACEKEEPSNQLNNPNGVLNKQNVGASANDILTANKFKTIVVELQYAQGFAPGSASVENLKKFMEKYINKPGGIVIKQSSIPAPGKTAYNVNDLAMIEANYRTEYTRTDTIAVYFFFTDSNYAEDTQDSKVLGVAYRNTSMAIFEKTVQQHSGGFNQPDRNKLETVIMQHEFAHILGLVNAGTEMQINHQDAPHGKHCDNSGCLMNWVVETGNVVTNLLGSSIPDLDQNCINDLRANGGK